MNAIEKKLRSAKIQLKNIFMDHCVHIDDKDNFTVAPSYNYEHDPDWCIRGEVALYEPLKIKYVQSYCHKRFDSYYEAALSFHEHPDNFSELLCKQYLQDILLNSCILLHLICGEKNEFVKNEFKIKYKNKVLIIGSSNHLDTNDITFQIAIACNLNLNKDNKWITKINEENLKKAIKEEFPKLNNNFSKLLNI